MNESKFLVVLNSNHSTDIPSQIRLFMTKTILLSLSVYLFSFCKPGEVSVNSSANEITSNSDVNRVLISKTGEDENRIKIIPNGRGQMTPLDPLNIQVEGSSGIQELHSILGFTDVRFPFRDGISITCIKQTHDVNGTTEVEQKSLAPSLQANMSFKIKDPGKWRVNLYY